MENKFFKNCFVQFFETTFDNEVHNFIMTNSIIKLRIELSNI